MQQTLSSDTSSTSIVSAAPRRAVIAPRAEDAQRTATPGGRALRRLKYFVLRFARLDVQNMWRLAGRISDEYRIPRLFVMVDMAVSSVRFYAGYHDYHEWDWHLLRAAERRTFLTRPQAHQLTLELNDRRYATCFTDKVRFNERFAPYLGRAWIDLRSADATDFAAFVHRHGRVMLKNNESLGGDGITPLRAEELPDSVHELQALRSELIDRGQVLVEEFIEQHPDLARLTPTSVNTIRVITYLTPEGSVEVLARVLKIGHGSPVDNFGSGGMQTTLDEQGRALYAAFDKEGRKYAVHPESGAIIAGTAVPMWDQVIDLVHRAARVVPQVPYVGWDVALTPGGPVLVEGNYDTGVFQMKPSISGQKEGLRPRYLEAISGGAPAAD